jgi:hypothetical protein
MSLIDLWRSDKDQIIQKRIDQLIAFAGDGKLCDGNMASAELRELLSNVPSDVLENWIEQCLSTRFDDFGFVFQDLVNEIGKRLGMKVNPGVYRGRTGHGYDGIWELPDKKMILVECKSSTTYSINLTKISNYRKQIAIEESLLPEDISILIVLGSEDTEDLEAQVRGSRYAWDIRLLGIKSLVKLLKLKETLDDPATAKQIQEILIPQEFTRLDGIIELVFATAKDIQLEEEIDDDSFDNTEEEIQVAKVAANFQTKILPRLEKHFGCSLVKNGRVLWASADESILLTCQVSKEYSRTNMHFWFGLKRTTKERLEQQENSFCVFGLGNPDRVILLPFNFLNGYLNNIFTSHEEDGKILHWHIRFLKNGEQIYLLVNRDREQIDVTDKLI